MSAERIASMIFALALLSGPTVWAQDSSVVRVPESLPPDQQVENQPQRDTSTAAEATQDTRQLPTVENPPEPTITRPQIAPDPATTLPRNTGLNEQHPLQNIFDAVEDSSWGLTPTSALFQFPEHLAGMVWHQPDSLDLALSELLEMRLTGVLVVRTSVIEDTLLLRAADELGMAFYQDLPVANLPAENLLDTLAYAERSLRAVLRQAQAYQSARHFGLARYADTSNPESRIYFEVLSRIIAEDGPVGSQTYYLTRFPEDDRCNQTVDFVLLDARQSDLVEVLSRWHRNHDTPAGIGALGAPVGRSTEGGWRQYGSFAYQARMLENGLHALLATERQVLVSFIYYWKDGHHSTIDQRAAVEGFTYGLITKESGPRPAMDVVRGFFTDTQRIFAFDAGSASRTVRVAAPMALLGWFIILAIGLVYWLSPQFGTLASKYFGRHDLYRESIQRGYDLNAGLNALIATGLSLAAGVTGASAIRGLARTDALATAISGWSLGAQERINQLLGHPLLLVILLALGYGLWVLFNIFWLYFLAGRRYRVRAQQALTLAIWSRWSIFFLMIGAMLLATFTPQTATAFAPVILFVWLGIEIIATGRMLRDFAQVSRVPIQRAILVGYGAPLGVITFVIVTVFVAGSAELGFLWHLATRQ